MAILVVEDDAQIAALVADGLARAGYDVTHEADGQAALERLKAQAWDAAVVDIMLPSLDGIALVVAARGAGVTTPIIFLSARRELDDRLLGLRAGGDDYLTKPFHFSELHARADAVLKRKAPEAVQTTLSCADLTMDLSTRRVARAGREITLLPREFKLLEYFLRHKEQVVTRTMLLERVWDYSNEPHTGIIDTHVSRLRKKIDEGFDAPLLHTVRGVGYRLSKTP